MKKSFALAWIVCVLCSFAQSFADEIVVDTNLVAGGEYYGDYYGGLTLEEILSASKSSVNDKIFKENYDAIVSNSVYEDWEYNSAHFDTKAMTYSIFMPSRLESRVKSIQITLEAQNYDYPVFGMDVSAKESEENSQALPVEVSIDIQKQEGEYLTGQVILNRKDLEMQNEYGQSFVARVYLNMKDGSVVPYSQDGYIYVNALTPDGIKQDLATAYYNSGEGNYGYVDVQRILSAAFLKVESNTDSLDEYLAILEKVLEKAETKQTSLNDEMTEIAESVKDDESFSVAIQVYGERMQKSEIISNAVYYIQTEIQTRSSSSIIDELFE